MHRILKVAQREYVETVKTKTFLLGLLMVPLIIGGIIFFSSRISQRPTGPRPPIKVAVTDLSEQLSAEIKDSFDEYNQSHPHRQLLLREPPSAASPQAAIQQGKENLQQGKVDVYVVLDKDIVEGTGKIHVYTYKPKPANVDVYWTVENLFRRAVTNRRCEVRGLSQELLSELRNVPVEQVELGSGPAEQRVQSQGEKAAQMMIPFFFVFLIFMGIVGMGQHILSGVIEEKNSRVIEVLLAALSPFELMAGKILGLAGIGLTVMSLWAGAAYIAASWQGVNIDVSARLLAYFVLYYILGFLLFSSILAGIGSVCNTIKETQSLMMPIMMVFMLPMLAWFNLAQNPDGMLARVSSFFPPLTPMVMVLRLSAGSDTPMIEILGSLAVLAAGALALMWAAAKIFRTGILMYGKRPGLGEVLRWLRQT
jgi:ABC-2 type transport system permease protein